MDVQPGIGRRAAIALPVVVIVAVSGFVLKAAGGFEMPLSIALNRHHHGVLGALGDLLYHVVGPVGAIIGTAVITAVLLLVTRRWTTAATFAVTIAGSWLSVAVVKLLVHRPRPDAAQLPLPYHPVQVDASYPSGHMAFVTAVVMTTLLMMPPGAWRRLVAVLGAILVGAVALLLTVDAVHYPTDVIASIVWVVAVAPLVHAIWVRAVLPRVGARRDRAEAHAIGRRFGTQEH
ncbi:phosphatase PAP2 family protein [Amnibacterium endophyticum]|uniref:Phosphatase PAP2 family protein n=1 Tax=Amnibacterium endophyticum TaxID=2109337 RepID=A0ABW4LBX9_9MICO